VGFTLLEQSYIERFLKHIKSVLNINETIDSKKKKMRNIISIIAIVVYLSANAHNNITHQNT
jgi:hypothetical protein